VAVGKKEGKIIAETFICSAFELGWLSLEVSAILGSYINQGFQRFFIFASC
jgi:hypothetical protein